MTKKILSLLLAAVLLICLAACGETPAAPEEQRGSEAVAEDKEATVPAEEPAEPEKPEEPAEAPKPEEGGPKAGLSEKGDGVSDVCDLVTGQKLETHNGAIVLHLDTSLEMEDAYRLDSVYAEVLTDRAVDRGWFYYYFTSMEDGAEWYEWEPAAGNYSTIDLQFSCVNLRDTPRKFGDTAKLRIVFDEGGNEKEYKGVTFQSNPGQIDADGYDVCRASAYREIEKDEETVVGFLVDIDKAFHDALVAEEIKEPTWAYFDFADGDSYCVNLRTDCVFFGYDDSDDDSMITSDVFRTLKTATGADFMEDFLKNSANFMEIAEATGINPRELAEGYASHFSLKVTDIVYDSETTATAFCTLTSPDFYNMYLNLDALGQEKLADIDKSTITEEDFYKLYGQLLVDYTKDPDFPHMTDELEIAYHFDEGYEQWYPDDRDAVMNEMRIALINF